MPAGDIITILIIAAAVASALRPRSTHGPKPTPSFLIGTVASEAPFMLSWYLILIGWVTVDSGRPSSPVGWAAAALGVLTLLGLVRIIWQSAQSMGVLDRALADAIGHLPRSSRVQHRLRAAWALTAPLRLPDPRVRRERNIVYGPAGGRANLLDVYRRRGTMAGPVLVYFHGCGFFSGSKSRPSKLMLETLALRGWVCVSANYRLRTDYPAILADAKRVIAWVRAEGSNHGADPSTLVVSGGSAGAHLSVSCALSAGQPELQPGFEDADTSVAAVIGLYGYYGEVYGQRSTAPTDFSGSELPPTLIVHGEKDPMAHSSAAREFVEKLRARREGPVAYAELPGAVHNFDLLASLRNAAVSTAALEFTTAIAEGASRRGS